MSKRRLNSGLLPALIIIVTILLAVFYAGPLKDQVAQTKADMLTEQTALNEAKTDLADLKALKSSIPEDRLGKEKLLRVLPVELEQDKLIIDLYDLAQNNGVGFSTLNFGLSDTKKDKGDISKVRISASFIGNYSDLIKFLQALEKSERKVHVRSISVQLQEAVIPGEPLKANFNLNMEAYYQGVIR